MEASLAAADAPTLELLGQSTSRWMQQAAAGSPSAAADTQQGSLASAADTQQKPGSTGTTPGACAHSSVDAAAATAAVAAVPAGTTPDNNALQPTFPPGCPASAAAGHAAPKYVPVALTLLPRCGGETHEELPAHAAAPIRKKRSTMVDPEP